jgi:Holliday junction resolvasome RuvABC endonuclease subunit|tara:strand:+ start:196 stop:750 length:555 start_codon:yes stop_codon:yes gene_type:complete
MITILGVDPGLAKCGWVRARMSLNGSLQVHVAGLIKTVKNSRPSVSQDNRRRAREIHRGIAPMFDGVDLVAFEAESLPRSSSAAAKTAMSRGVLIGICEERRIPMIEATPQAIKAYLTGNNGASKKQVEAAVLATAGFESMGLLLENVAPSQREHAYDAAGAILACQNHEIVLAMLQMTHRPHD